MAYKETSLNDGWKLSCTATETGTDTSANTSTISVTGRIWRTSTSWAFSYTGAGKLEIYWHDTNNGTDQWLASLDITEIGYSVSERTLNKTFSVAHKADGKLSGWAWAVWTKYYNSGNIPPSGSAYTDEFSMTDIPRGAKMTTASDFNDEANPTISYSNPAGTAATTLRVGIFNTGGTTAYAAYRDVSKTGTSYTFNLTSAERSALRNAIPNAKTLRVRFYIRTEIGSNAFLDYKEVTMTIINGTPTFSNFTFADTNSTTTGVTGNNQVMISGKSSLSATISAANKAVAVKGASITKYTFAIAGLTAEQAYSTSDITKALGSPTVASNELPSGTRSLVITAIDSRGFTKAVTKTVTIVPYNNPIVNASATRANNFESTTTIKINGTISRIEVGGTAKNTVNTSNGVQYRYKASTTSTWGSWTNRTATINTGTGAVTTSNFTLELDNQTAYDFQMRITDKLVTTTVNIAVPVGQPAMWLGSDGRVGIGGMPSFNKQTGETGLLEVKGRIRLADGRYLDNIQEGAWWQARSKSVVRNTSSSTNNAYAPTVDMMTRQGDWSLGTLKSDTEERLYFGYVPNTAYEQSINNGSKQVYFRPDGINNLKLSNRNSFDGLCQYKSCARTTFTTGTAWGNNIPSGWDFTITAVTDGIYKITCATTYLVDYTHDGELDFNILVTGASAQAVAAQTFTGNLRNSGIGRSAVGIYKATGTSITIKVNIVNGFSGDSCEIFNGCIIVERVG